ncbi:MAG: T9SS type A sorting domain-containing protein [bacterium]|nr:T9SS type A sorting domain-containing protein [bacterium]
MKTKFWGLLLAVLMLTALSAWAQWQLNGNATCTATGNQLYPTIVSDGAGGAIITWYDYRSGSNYDIYAQRVNAAGVALWTADGVAICTATDAQLNPTIVSDGAGGAIITWYDARSGANDIYAQRISAAGVAQWTADGVAVCAAASSQYYPTIVSDGAGGAIITWQDYRSGTSNDIYAQRINALGVVQWTADGVAICTATADQNYPTIVSDGSSGAIITWYDVRSGTSYDIYAQRVNALGAVQWAANGLAICTATGNQQYPTIVSDGAGGAIITWHDNRSGTYDIYAQRVNAAGAAQWTADGVAICTATGTQQYPTIVSAGAGGAIITWHDGRSGTNDIYAQRINALGVAQWTADGVAICTATGNQLYPTIISDGAGGAIITWYDARISTADIYAQRLDRGDGSYYGRNAPDIVKAPDIPNDQGGFVNLQWTPSYLDVYPDTTISFYSLWRSLSGTGAKGARRVEASDVTKDFTGTAYRIIEKGGKAYAWEWIANIPWRHYLTAYSYPMPTLCDTLTGEMAWHHFFVSAQTDNPQLYWDSEPDSGYSVDNLAPAKVKGLGGETPAGLLLTWKSNIESDLKNYAVYYNGTFLGFTSDTVYTYAGTLTTNDNFTVKACDIHDNQGLASDPWIYLGPMAVHLSFFTVGQTNEAVELNWRTESETDCATWIIQRSSSGATAFQDIGKMPGQGTSTMPHDYIYRDSEQLETGDYLYRIVEISATGNKTSYQPVSVTYKSNTPVAFCLNGAFPNPSRGQTTFKYQLPVESRVRLEVYNVSGQLVKTVFEGVKPAGYHEVGWSDHNLSNGIYFYILKAGKFSATRKLVILK